MKCLPLFTLGLVISVFSLFFSTSAKAVGTCNHPGDTCSYVGDKSTCQGSCDSKLVCTPLDHEICSPNSTITPPPIITPPTTQTTGIYIGVQVPKAITILRLLPSQYSFQWVKIQYSLGSSQDLEGFIRSARGTSSGGGNTYQVLVSVAKNTAGIETLKNPDTYPPQQAPDYYTHKYCPYDEELETYQIPFDDGFDPISGESRTRYEEQKAKPKSDNGYIKFRDQMEALAPKLSGSSAVEIWNEPNLEDEWTHQGLGPVSPENYVNFMNCGIKGLRKGGYNGTVISAGLAPNAYATATGQTNMNDITFFNTFVAKGGLTNINAIGWHSNITSNIAPADNPNDDGFKRVQHALGNTKPVWITEFGWDRSTFHKGTDLEDRKLQAQYIAQAYQVADKLGGIKGMFVWNFGWTIDSRDQTAFAPWDIEGSVPQGLLCQPNPPRDPNASRNRTDTKYVQDPKVNPYPALIEIANRGLVTDVVVKDVDQNIKTVDGTKVDVTKSFLSELLGFLDPITSFLCSLSWLGIDNGTYCTPTLSIGKVESNVQGKNTKEFAMKAEILGKASIPEGMTLIPEVKDCNIGKLGTAEDPGDTNLNNISKYLGTSAGFLGNNIPNFKNTAPDEWNNLLETRMKTENINAGTKLFQQDQRDPEECLQLKNKIVGSFPPEVLPPNMTCDDVYNLILQINQNHFQNF